MNQKVLSKDKIKLITSKGGGGLYRDFVVELKVSGGGDAQCELIECLNKIMTLL